jgi:zinc protease
MKTIQLEIDERQLENGLTLLAVQNPGVETFAAGVVLDVDRRDEAKGEEGLANLLGDCLEEGTKRLTAVQLAEAIDSLGGTLSGSASGGSMHCPATETRKMLRLLAEVTVASHRFRQEVYGSHPFGRPIRGTLRSVARFGPKDLRRFHRRWFRPTGGYIAAAGPEPPEQTLDMLAKIFSGLDDKPVEHQRPQPPAMSEKVRDIHLPMKREQVHVYLGHPGVRRQNPDFYSLLVMDHILGTGPGFTSRISKRLRDEDGLCYSVHASITSSAGEEPGCFTAYIGTSAEHRQKATRGFLQEIDRIRQEHVAAEELRDVQEYLTGSFVFALERNANLARYAIRAKRFGLGFDYVHRYPELIRSVTIEDVQTVAQRYLHPDRVVIVSAGAS